MARVLIIIGERSFRMTLREMLEVDGHEVIESANGPHGLWLYMTHSIDVVVAGITMPERNSLGTICTFRESYPWSRIIGISDRGVFNQRQLQRIAETIGIDSVLEKPLIGSELKAAVDGLLQAAS